MWILVLYFTLASYGAPTTAGTATAEFPNRAACESAVETLHRNVSNFAKLAAFESVLQTPVDAGRRGAQPQRIWTIKAVCLPKDTAKP